MNAFSDFYQISFERLKRRAALYNESLLREEQPLLRPFFENMADLNEGGKMLRGVLVILGYQMARRAAGQTPADSYDISIADDAALAFEVFQTGVLIHDDIIDRAETRRGKPTMTVRYENSLAERGIVPPGEENSSVQVASSAAICAGDYLITESTRILSEACRDHPRGPEVLAAFCGVILDTIRGELLDVILPAEMADPARRKDEADALLKKAVNDIYHLKTARYSVIGPLHLGMLLGDMPEAVRDAVDGIADDLGIAFQIKDDILGIFADEAELGKDIGSDIAEFKQTILYTYVRLCGGESYRKLLRYYGKTPVAPADLKAVQEIFRESGALKAAEAEMEKHFDRAFERLDALKALAAEDREILRDFISYNRERRK